MTYKLDLEEQDSSADIIGDSCVYNIVDGDEITIEQVNVKINKNNSMTITHIEDNESTITGSVNDKNHKLNIITDNVSIDLS